LHRRQPGDPDGDFTVTRKLTAAELAKAARNLRRIEGFLLARSQWSLDPPDRAPFDELRAVVDRLAFTVGQRTLQLGIDTGHPQSAAVEPVPRETFDGAMLSRFSEFLGQLDRWFVGRSDAVPDEGAGRYLAEIRHSLESTRQALITIDENQEPSPTGQQPDPEDWSPPEPATDAFTAPGTVEQRPPVRGPSSALDDIYEGSRDEAGKPPPEPPELIAFTDSATAPMFEWIGAESVQLTDLGKQRVEELFEEQGVSFFRYQLENFVDEIRKRIENAPEGHVLVIKVRTIGDERKPFLSYVARDALSGDS
jgi:hypothetical protein